MITINKYFLIIILTLMAFSFNYSLANNDSTSIPRNKLLIKYSLNGLFDPILSNIRIGLEKQITNYFSYSIDVAYINNSLLKSIDWDERFLEGFKCVNEIKLSPNKFNNHFIYFFGVNAGINSYKSYKNIEVSKFYYSELKKEVKQINSYYCHIISGFQDNLFRTNRLFLEMYIGVGIRYKMVHNLNSFDTENNNLSVFYLYNTGERLMPSIILETKICYKLFK